MPFFQLPPTGSITPEWLKAMRLQLDREDDEAEQKIRMSLERRFEREMRAALDDMMHTLFPEGYGEFVNPQIEANRIHEAFLRDQKMRDTVSRAIQDSADLGVSVAVKQLEGVGYGFDYTLANVSAREWAIAHTDTLLNQLGTTSGKVVGQALGRWVGNGEPLQSLINDLAPAFGQARAERIAATEVTRAYAEGSTRTYQESGVVQKVEWAASMDERVCPICAPLNGKTVALGGKFDGLYPPAHVGCRCWVLPVVKEPKRERKPKDPKPPAPVAQPQAPLPIVQPVTPTLSPPTQFVRSQIRTTAQEFGVTDTDVENTIRQYIPTLTNGDVALRLPSQQLDNVLRDGRLKSQFETGRSAGGGINKDARAEAEENGLGIARNIDPAKRPIYAYVRHPFSEEYVEAYGDTTVVFKRDVRQSSTYTIGDSLDNMRRNQVSGVPLDQTDIEAWGGNVNRLYRMATGRTTPDAAGLDYVEVQIRGATVDKIAHVIDNERKMLSSTLRQLRASNIDVLDTEGKVIN